MLKTNIRVLTIVVIISAGVLCAPICRADTLASYSVQYTADLEQKQMLLESIKEDAGTTESALRHEGEKVRSAKSRGLSRLNLDRIDMAEIMPASEKINLAFINMNCTLSPRRSDSYQSPPNEKASE